MSKNYLAILIMALSLASCFSNITTDTIDLQALQIKFMNENVNWSKAAKTNDASYISNLYEPEAWLGIPGKEFLVGKDVIAASWEQTVKLVDDLGFKTLSLKGSKEMLYETGLAFTSYTANGESKIDTSKYLIVWKLNDKGNYKIAADLFN